MLFHFPKRYIQFLYQWWCALLCSTFLCFSNRSVHSACDVAYIYATHILCYCCNELQEAKDDLHENAQLLEARKAELKLLNKQLIDSEEQKNSKLQKQEAEWNSLQKGYHKVG